jgi:hypothetical protein
MFKKYSLRLALPINLPILILILFLCSCAHNLAVTKEQSEIDLSKQSIALLSVKISNQNKPKYQLDLWGTCICPGHEKCIAMPNWHTPDTPYNSEEKEFKEYLLSFGLQSGTHNIHLIKVSYHIPLILRAMADVPIDLSAEIKPNSVVYLGHLDIVLREKKSDNEVRAALFPLIDAAVVGFSTGTFDVTVEDRYNEDIKLYTSEYPALQNKNIEKSLLSPWIRPENIKTSSAELNH